MGSAGLAEHDRQETVDVIMVESPMSAVDVAQTIQLMFPQLF